MKKVIYKDWFNGWKRTEIMAISYEEENGYSFFMGSDKKLRRCLSRNVISIEEIDGEDGKTKRNNKP